MTDINILNQLMEHGFDGIISISNYGRCAYWIDNDVVKLVRIKTKMTRGSRIAVGDIGFVLKTNWRQITECKTINIWQIGLSICPLMNIPGIVRVSTIVDYELKAEFVSLLLNYVKIIPNDENSVLFALGNDFFLRNQIERTVAFSTWLRAVRFGEEDSTRMT